MRIWPFKTPAERQEELDRMIAEGERMIEDRKIDDEEKPPSTSMDVEIQKLWAQITAIKEMINANNERLHKLSESIGDVRRKNIELEKDLNSLEGRIIKTINLVENVQPQVLLNEVKKLDAKIEKLESKQESNKTMLDHIIEELKDIRKIVSTFKGLESVMKLKKGLEDDIKNANKTMNYIHRDVEKVENIFVQVQKRYDDVVELSEKFNTIEKRFDELLKTTDKFFIESKNFANRDELIKLKKSIDLKLRPVDEIIKEVKEAKERFNRYDSYITQYLDEVENLKGILEERLVEINDKLSKLSRMEAEGYITKTELDKNLEDLYTTLMDRIGKIVDKKTKKN